MFPNVNLTGAAKQAETALSGVGDTLPDVANAAKRLGLDPGTIEGIFRKHGQGMAARAVCQALGTTPEALKADADKIFGVQTATKMSSAKTRFPRLK